MPEKAVLTRSVGRTKSAPVTKVQVRRPALDRQIWIDEALATLATAGESAVRVEVLARAMGVTKGSFYWHFRDREDLLKAMIDEWYSRTTTNVVERLWGRPQDARTKLKRLWQICFSGRPDNPGGRLEVAIRQWATYSPCVAAVIAANDEERLAFVASLYEELGCEDPGAFARLFYFQILGRNFASQMTTLVEPKADTEIMRALLIA